MPCVSVLLDQPLKRVFSICYFKFSNAFSWIGVENFILFGWVGWLFGKNLRTAKGGETLCASEAGDALSLPQSSGELLPRCFIAFIHCSGGCNASPGRQQCQPWQPLLGFPSLSEGIWIRLSSSEVALAFESCNACEPRVASLKTTAPSFLWFCAEKGIEHVDRETTLKQISFCLP